MAAPTYSSDLSTINVADTAGGTTNWSALGGGASGLNSETDYFIQGDGCISKNGFTGATKGMIYNAGAQTITTGDAVFMWARQANRNLLDTKSAGGGQLLVGSGSGAYKQFYVDGSDVDGSDLISWVSYAVDPTQTASATTGSPTATTSYFGYQWKILGSGSLKGAPNGIDAFRHGRELRCVNGDGTSGYATFDGAAAWDANTARRAGILTPVAGGYQFHGDFVMGQSTTAVDFRDSNRNIVVLDDEFVSSTFNEMEIINASSNVEWTNIQISHLGTTSPTTLNLNVGTFTAASCRFDGCGITTLASTSSATDCTWANSAQVIGANADLDGSSILTPTVAADEGALYWNETISTPTTISDLDNMTFSQGTAAHHAIRFGTGVTADITLRNIEFTDFSGTDDVNGSTFRFDATSGSLNLNLVGCTVGGVAASSSNIGIDDAAGIAVTLVIDPVTTKFTVQDEDMNPIQNARVFTETSDSGGGSGFPYQAAVTSLSQSAGTATLTSTANHGLSTGDKVVVRDAQPDGYNKIATITVTGSNAFTYSVDSGLSSPATGTIVFSYVPVHGLTDVNGEIQSSKTWPASQGISGWARKSNTSSPFYKQSLISVADGSGGTDQLITLSPDE